MRDIILDNFLHPDDVIYNALLDGGEEEIISMKYAVLGAIHDSEKPENDRIFYKDEPEFMDKLMSIVKSALRANPEKVRQTINEWFKLVNKDLADRKLAGE